eukprot:TRINITY_DN3636_c0_g1_i3.p1 TRINITY_DN3636_c0_g1~~TRINITY_DN3636_c0_g1_i3.p1  ORF type:complete len:247 (-),score=46.49 TRINITY_DN3636_c0_g1_i3:100-840(-)
MLLSLPFALTNLGIPFRIEYPASKSLSCARLLAHSFILTITQQLLATPDFIPTWDSLVFKEQGDGVPIKWHRDASAESVDDIPAIDIGIYLDEANTKYDNCLWVIPGSHKWPDFMAAHMIDHLTLDGFKKSGAVPVEVEPGDVVLHNILILHGSPACVSPLRRTVYYEYRAIDQEIRMGPHREDYIPIKQKVLLHCIEERKKTNYDQQTKNPQFEYTPTTQIEYEYNPNEHLRYPHKDYFRNTYKG